MPADLLVPWLLAGLALGALGTWLARVYAVRRRLIDEPGERRSHQEATPRGGGISIVAVLLAAMLALALHAPVRALALALAAAGLVLVAGIGWIDDHRPLSARLRLVVHALAAALLCGALWRAGGAPLDLAIAFAAVLVLVNVWNFMDGINGIAASQAAVVALAYVLFVSAGPVFWLGLALAAGACGFLPFNFPRARIFLGDVGSGALGYALAGLLALASINGDPATRLLLAMPLLPFLIDASLTLLARIVRGERWWEPHTQHAYQAWARRRGHARVTVAYACAAAVAAGIAFAMYSSGIAVIMVSYGVLLGLGGMAWRRLRERSMDKDQSPLQDRTP